MDWERAAKYAGVALTATKFSADIYGQARGYYNQFTTYTVKVDEKSEIYNAVHRWVMSNLGNSRAVQVKVKEYYDHKTDKSEARVALLHDDQRRQHFVFEGFKVAVTLEKASTPSLSQPVSISMFTPDAITFAVRSRAAQDALVRKLEAITTEWRLGERKPTLYLMSAYGDWRARSDIPHRTPESVVLREGQTERIIHDLSTFLADESAYVKRGIPWHRGYLFYGPPGTGKTSLAKALAGHFALDLWYASLGDLDKDTNLVNLISRIDSGGVLLLEDIDTLNATKSRDSKSGEISMSALLNVLDGIATPHGLITIMTTNDKSSLDPAIMRSGRMDLVEHIDMPDIDQLERYFETFYGYRPVLEGAPNVAMSDVTEIFKRNMYDPDNAELELQKTLGV